MEGISYSEAQKIPRPARPIPYFIPSLGKEEEEEVQKTLQSGWLTSGTKVVQFEQALQEYLGGKREVIAVSSCTAALELSLVVAGVKPGDAVIVPSYTFVSTVNVILHLGAMPVFCDIHPETLNIHPEKIPSLISPSTKVILPVHFGGFPADLQKIYALASAHRLLVVEDAAHALSAEVNGKKIGSFGDFVCFSFYANKNITTGEGGAISVPGGEWSRILRLLKIHGMSASAWERHSSLSENGYDVLMPGYKFNLPDVLASIGIHQLKKIAAFQERRKEIARLYRRSLSQFPGISLPRWDKENVECSYHLFPILLNLEKCAGDRNQFLHLLYEEGVQASVHYKPVHLFSFYQKKFGFREGDFPVSEEIYRQIVSLPIYPTMTDEMVYMVLGAVSRALQRCIL